MVQDVSAKWENIKAGLAKDGARHFVGSHHLLEVLCQQPVEVCEVENDLQHSLIAIFFSYLKESEVVYVRCAKGDGVQLLWNK